MEFDLTKRFLLSNSLNLGFTLLIPELVLLGMLVILLESVIQYSLAAIVFDFCNLEDSLFEDGILINISVVRVRLVKLLLFGIGMEFWFGENT